MRKSLFIILLLPLFVAAQYDSTKVRQSITSYGYDWKNGKFKSLIIPSDTMKMAVKDSNALAFVGGKLLRWTGYHWENTVTATLPIYVDTMFRQNDSLVFIKNGVEYNLGPLNGIDSMWIVDGGTDPDTLRYRFLGTVKTGGILYGSRSKIKAVFFVSENYSGAGAAVIGSFSNTSVTSGNSMYTAQLSVAKMGSITNPFPDPWTARNAALDSIANGSIAEAKIIVLKGMYTVGSNVAANNGDSTGNDAVATVADIGFTSADALDTASLMRNKINYEFTTGTGLIMINKTYAIFAGCYNVDASHNSFVSGIYGNGNYTIVYGQGIIPALSQRFIQVNNSRADIAFHFNKAIMQRAWLFVYVYKSVFVKGNVFIGDRMTFLVDMSNGNTEDNGDGSPASLYIDIANVYKGNKYYPYAPAPAGASNFAPLIATDVSPATRQKNYNFTLKNVYLFDVNQGVLVRNFSSPVARDMINLSISVNIDFLEHTLDTVGQVAMTSGYPLIVPISIGSPSSFKKENIHQQYNIKTAIIDNGLVAFQLSAPDNAGSKNNSITVNSDYIIRRRLDTITSGTQYGTRSVFTLGYLHANSTNIILGEKVNISVNVKKCIALAGKCFGEYGVHESRGDADYTQYAGNTIISGSFISNDGSPVMELNGKGVACILKDAVFIAKGSATNSIKINNGGNAVSIYTKDFLTNLPLGSGITQYGTYTTDTNVSTFY